MGFGRWLVVVVVVVVSLDLARSYCRRRKLDRRERFLFADDLS